MMPDRRLSLRTLTVAVACAAIFSAGMFAFPANWLSHSWLVATIHGFFEAPTDLEDRSSNSPAVAPTAVLLSWNTFGNAGTETSEPSVSNDPNLLPSNLTLGAGVTPAANANRLGGNSWFDASDTNPTTLTESIAGNDYIQFAVTPNSGIAFTPTSLVFVWDRSSSGASSVTLRSSADGFSSDLGTVSPIGVGTFVSNTITISGLSNLTTPTTFRMYGYGATTNLGTGGFDAANNNPNVTLNGSVASVPAPAIQVTGGPINFGNQTVNTTSGSQSVIVTNTGSANLVLGTPSFTTGTQFALASDPNGTVVAPAESTTVSFTFTPTSAGVKSDTVTINSNASGAAPTVPLNGTGVSPEPPAQVTTEAATLVTGTSATLNGLANPNGSATTGYFDYGTTNTGDCLTLGTRAPVSGGTDLGAGTNQLSFSRAISGLTPASVYYFCAAGENAGGTGTGAIFQFTTSSPPSSVATAAATSVTAMTATLNGLANPNGVATTGYFYYGTTDTGNCLTLGTRAPLSGGEDIGSGTDQLPFSQAISALTPSTTYYFCAVAESNGGVVDGSIFSFITPARTLVVDNTSDLNTMDECTAAANDCSLRGAVAAAQDGDTITFDTGALGIETLSAATITLGGSEIFIDDDITIDGPGANLLTISGNNLSRVFRIAGSAAEIDGLTVTGGSESGMMIGSGFVTLDGMHVTGNSGTDGGGIKYVGNGSHSIHNSTISANQASGAGGGIQVEGVAFTLTITNSTISGNSATDGGGINLDSGEVILSSSTVTANTAAFGSGVTVNAPGFPITVGNSIIAGNTNAAVIPDVSGNFGSAGFNLIGNPGSANGFTATGDQVGSSGTPLDPKLGPLQNNGGPTFTHGLLNGSPAIDQGEAIGTDVDQRGMPRPTNIPSVVNAASGDGSDIGAFEMLAPTAAQASISGRVRTVNGVGIRGALVSVQGMDGVLRRALTNSFGYYRIDGLQVGESFVVSASARRYAFAAPTQFVDLADSISDLNFTASR